MAKDRLAVNHETQNLELHICKERLAATTVAKILAWLKKTPYAAVRVDLAELEAQLLQAKNSDDDAHQALVLGPVEPASLIIDVAKDKLSAFATMQPARGGKGLSRTDILQLVAKTHIKHGVCMKAVNLLVQYSDGKQTQQPLKCTIAHHTPSQEGEPAKLEQLSMTLKDRLLKPKETLHGKVDPKDFGAIVSVREGQPLVRRHPPTEGITGKDVMGSEIKVGTPKDIQLKADEGTTISEEDENLLLAATDGIPVLTEFGMKVVDTLELDKVNAKSGHVDYAGSIVIKGDVGEGMKVSADGDVLIMGTAEACEITATGDITIEQGVFGHRDHDGAPSCKLSSEGSIAVNRAQNVSLHAKKNVHVATQALHCDISCEQDLTIGMDTPPKGDLVGGSVSIGGSLHCGNIGTDAGAATQIDLGISYRTQLANVEHARGQWKQEQEALQELLNEIAHIKSQQNTPELQRQLEMCQSFYAEQEKDAYQFKQELRIAQEQLIACLKTIDVVVSQNLHQKVNFHLSDDIKLETLRAHGPSHISFSGKGLKLDPYQIDL